jgi:hypothetical protein
MEEAEEGGETRSDLGLIDGVCELQFISNENIQHAKVWEYMHSQSKFFVM